MCIQFIRMADGMKHTIGILGGTGAEGMGLALRFARAGSRVVIGSRNFDRAVEAARTAAARTGGEVEGRLNPDAAEAEIVVLTVPLAAQIATLKSVRERLRRGTVLVDATVPLEVSIGGRLTHTLGLWAGSAAEQAARYAPEGVAVVAAFHSLSAELLAALDEPVDCDVLICGDNEEAKTAVADLAGFIAGARAVDAGPLEAARMVESLAALLIGLNVRQRAKHAGVRITGLL
jgi:NADPH-dependent F420 reductase